MVETINTVSQTIDTNFETTNAAIGFEMVECTSTVVVTFNTVDGLHSGWNLQHSGLNHQYSGGINTVVETIKSKMETSNTKVKSTNRVVETTNIVVQETSKFVVECTLRLEKIN